MAKLLPQSFDSAFRARLSHLSWPQWVDLMGDLELDRGEFSQSSTPAERLTSLAEQLTLHGRWGRFWECAGRKYGIFPAGGVPLGPVPGDVVARVPAGVNAEAEVGDSPFHLSSAVPPDHPSYIEREVDGAFRRLLAGPDRLISLTGVYGARKSSLMQRTRGYLPGCRCFFGGGVADMRSDDAGRFMRNFFRLFHSQFGRIDEWDELREALEQEASVLFLDDLGDAKAPGLGELIPALYTQVVEKRIPLRVVATSPKPLREIFAQRGLDNSKYSSCWTRLTVPSFQPAELHQLLRLLPPRALAQAEGSIREIEKRSALNPRALQYLCQRLWEAERAGQPDTALRILLQSQSSYE